MAQPIGTSADKIPANGLLGKQAFLDTARITTEPKTPHEIGQLVFELVDDTTLAVKVKGKDGVVRSTTLTLA